MLKKDRDREPSVWAGATPYFGKLLDYNSLNRESRRWHQNGII
jgi:hypothetical protein